MASSKKLKAMELVASLLSRTEWRSFDLIGAERTNRNLPSTIYGIWGLRSLLNSLVTLGVAQHRERGGTRSKPVPSGYLLVV